MEEEDNDDKWRPQQFYLDVISGACEPIGGELLVVGGRARESPETGDPVRATKTICSTIRISLNYRGHGGSDAYPQMISIPLLKSKVGGNFATAAISGLQLQRSLSEETTKVHKLQEKVVKHEKAFQVKSSELTWHRPNSCNFSLHLSAGGREKAKLSNRGPAGVAQKATKGPC
ncbi:hypothetical protein CY35_02G116800 [Sphagnum magellanicum]|nr:hypothetical protein CY35_02G116800 [Sphagnum magellanicum]